MGYSNSHYMEYMKPQINKKGVSMTDTFRKEYKPLTEEQKTQMDLIKTKAEELLSLLDQNTPLPGVNGVAGRCMSIAKTELETAVMWAVKGVTA